ncbi:hypothetical protein KR018_010407 [Drosophila ironensis]|nr:hypothetical protein KR018_010407 [Drosophila ironensis]
MIYQPFLSQKALEKVSVKHINLLKNINSTYQKRPGNSANNTEFEKYFNAVITAINLTSYDLDIIIDTYTDFKIYNRFRLDLEQQLLERLKNIDENLKLKKHMPKCHEYFKNFQSKIKGSLTQTNLIKMDVLHSINVECDDVEIFETTIAIPVPKKIETIDTQILNILRKYNLRPWGRKPYLEFDEQIWKLFIATVHGDEKLKRLKLNNFLIYDDKREQLDKAIALKIGTVKQKIRTTNNNTCMTEYVNLNKKLTLALFKTLKEKKSILVTKESSSCQ